MQGVTASHTYISCLVKVVCRNPWCWPLQIEDLVVEEPVLSQELNCISVLRCQRPCSESNARQMARISIVVVLILQLQGTMTNSLKQLLSIIRANATIDHDFEILHVQMPLF